MSFIRLNGVEKEYKTKRKQTDKRQRFCIRSIDLSIKKGEFFTLLGPSGCGKTTILKLVAGLLRPDRGDICIENKEVTRVPPEQRGVSMVFQEALLFPHMTVGENISFGLKMKKINKRERTERANDFLKLVGLEGMNLAYPSQLSGGQKQRVSLARALVTKPEILLMDEPFSALDPGTREEMRRLLKKLHRELDITILFVTHDREEAFELSDRVAVLKNGKILEVGMPKDLYERTDTVDVAEFLGLRNIYYGIVYEQKFSCDAFQLQLLNYEAIDVTKGWLVIRPETLSIQKDNINTETNSQYLQGTMMDISYKGSFYNLNVQVGNENLYIIQDTGTEFTFVKGGIVWIGIDSTKLHFIKEI
ncbi:ABC transporter ATP-binding protein [Aquibacillus kalidii]|uniref:ABC transporter ATP-binding protein n=1 Tax=Aquibacillus kalidii TaxID=2762597 RepID=UPI0016474C2D|nr:ABC transporter ATP-binding protein [Aquibacillus kalidii]